MLDYDVARSLLEGALRYSPADQTEIVLGATEHGLTRIANGGIHQNVSVADAEARVRVVLGQRVGVATDNRLSTGSLQALVDQAVAVARVSEPNPEFGSLPAPEPATPFPAPDVDPSDFTPERRAEAAAILTRAGAGQGQSTSGFISTDLDTLAVGNSLGARTFHCWTTAGVMAIMTAGDASGFASWDGATLRDAPAGEVAARASGICGSARDAQPVEPGRYTVILEPAAVAEMLTMLAVMGLGATAYQEGRSFMSGKVGEQLAGENITLRDDTYHPGMITLPFDYEGVPRRVVPFFERGVAKGVVYDSLTAHKAGLQPSTGHALPAPNPYGPQPMHLVLDAGGHARERMIREVERGILVTRFHYVNIVHPKETIITGMTRDGTFLIENGAITRPVKNLRFTQNILEALRRVSALENTQKLVNNEGTFCLAPAMRIEDFAFTS
ncbi:MAG: TldD/PmbA family protein [Armatimonadota bacterium]